MNKNARNVGTVHTHTHTHTHTGVLDNNKKTKIYERDIYENASNCGAKRKIELNVVGADASVRPQDQNKLMSDEILEYCSIFFFNKRKIGSSRTPTPTGTKI